MGQRGGSADHRNLRAQWLRDTCVQRSPGDEVRTRRGSQGLSHAAIFVFPCAELWARRDYQTNIRAVRQPLRVLVGQNDEVFYAGKFATVFKAAGKAVPVRVLPGIDHISLTLEPVAIEAAIAAVESMDHETPN